MPSKPEWAIAPVNRFLAHSLELRQLWLISIQGLSMSLGMSDLRKLLTKRSQENAAKGQDNLLISLDETQDAATFATGEIQKGYPRLTAHALVGLWGAFEVLIEDLLIAFLLNDPKYLSNAVFSKIKLPLAEFELLEKEERMRFLIGEFEKTSGLKKRYGVDRVELLLEPFGLSGDVSADTRKEIRAMHFIRNVLVHRASTADRKIVDGCPWLGLTIGQPIVVKMEMFVKFSNALNDYGTEIVHRVNAKFGIDSRKPKETIPLSGYPA